MASTIAYQRLVTCAFYPTLRGSVVFAFSKILRRLLSNLEQSHLHTLMLVALYQHVYFSTKYAMCYGYPPIL